MALDAYLCECGCEFEKFSHARNPLTEPCPKCGASVGKLPWWAATVRTRKANTEHESMSFKVHPAQVDEFNRKWAYTGVVWNRKTGKPRGTRRQFLRMMKDAGFDVHATSDY